MRRKPKRGGLVPRVTFQNFLKELCEDDRVREMAFAIAIYEDRVLLQQQLRDALSRRSNASKRKLVEQWRICLGEERTDELLRVLRNREALEIIMSWKLVDPRH